MIATPVPRETLMHVVKTMPAAPQILARLGHLLLDMNSGLDEITALLRCDSALTAHILRVANSAVFNSGQPFASLEEALARVGLSEVYRLTGFAAVAQFSDRNLPFYGITGTQLRENSLLTALVMEALAGPSGVDPRTAYTAGLLRSIGKIALDRLTRDHAYHTDSAVRIRGPLAEWETGFVGLSNCEAATVILETWHFPEKTIAAIRDHYSPGSTSSAFTHLLNLAAGAAERCGHGLPAEHYYWSMMQEKLDAAGIEEAFIDSATRYALEQFGPIRSALG